MIDTSPIWLPIVFLGLGLFLGLLVYLFDSTL